MRDDVTFEARLADAFGRYAGDAPTTDDEDVARQAIAAGRSARRFGRLASLRPSRLDGLTSGRPASRFAYVLIVLAVAMAAIMLAIAAGTLHNDSIRPLARNGTIAFTVQGNDHGPATTHLMNPDGTGDQPTDTSRCPTYSADGSLLASLSYEESAYLVVAGTGGQPARKMLLVEAPQTTVPWAVSPDGSRVAWFKPAPAGATGSLLPDGSPVAATDSLELWVAPIAGGPGTRVLPGSDASDEIRDSLTWSPDGGHIAFGTYVADLTTGERRRRAISVVASDGSDLRRLTTRPGLLGDGLSWSPDGRYLAYLGLPDAPAIPTSPTDDPSAASAPRDLFVIGADGTGDRNLTDSPLFETQPEWSPDGGSLAFEANADGEASRLSTIRMNGPTPIGLPALGPETPWFVWSPDGKRLLWLELATLGSETYRSTLDSIDRDFQESPMALQTVDGQIVCAPTWQRLEP